MFRDRNHYEKEPDQILKTSFNKQILDVHTSIPCSVTSFNSENRTLSAKPIPKRKFGNEMVEMPELIDIPIIYPSSSSYQLTFPINIGDIVLVLFSERQIETLFGLDENETRNHDLSDGMALPGFQLGTPVPNSLYLGGSGSSFIQADGNVSLTASGRNDQVSSGLKLKSNGEELLPLIKSVFDKLNSEPNLVNSYTEGSNVENMQ